MSIKSSIKLKLNISFVVLVSLLLSISGFYGYTQQKQQLEEQFSQQTMASLSRLAGSLPEAVWNYETELAANIIQSEMSAQGVSSIIAWSGEDIVYGSLKKAGELLQTEEAPKVFSRELSQELTFIEDDTEKTVGKVSVFTDESHIQVLLDKQLIQILVEIILLDIILVFCLSWLLSTSVLRRLTQVTDAIADIAEGEGDLTCRIDNQSKDELGKLCDSFNLVIIKLQKVMLEVSSDAEQLTQTAQQTSQITEQTTNGVQSLKSETTQVATAIHQMSATTIEVANNAALAAKSAQLAQQEANRGKETLNITIDEISQLSDAISEAETVIKRVADDSNSISSILDVIREIAEQTNMLALNAAIEAARAGEQGRGFAVVADEVRTLAQRTQQATEEIQKTIEKLQSGSQEAVTVSEKALAQTSQVVGSAQKTGEGIEAVTNSIQEIATFTSQIAEATEQQSSVANEVDQNVTNISNITDETADGAIETARANELLAQLSVNLQKVVNQFKV